MDIKGLGNTIIIKNNWLILDINNGDNGTHKYISSYNLLLTHSFIFSCFVSSNNGLSAISWSVILKSLQIFLTETTPMFWLFLFSILYIVDGDAP